MAWLSARSAIELSQGYTGYLNTHEPWFYIFDTLPLFLAIIIYIPFWPGKYITEEKRIVRPGNDEDEFLGDRVGPEAGQGYGLEPMKDGNTIDREEQEEKAGLAEERKTVKM